MSTELVLAAVLNGERERLTHVLADMSDQTRKREYADWLTQQGDSRGEFLLSVLDKWEAGAVELPTNDSLSLTWQRTCGITLLQKMREQRLDSVVSIFRHIRPAMLITPTLPKGKLPLGTSKFGGLPDLPPAETWPTYQGRLHTFVGQINLSEIAPIQAAKELPTAGLLSFFVYDDPNETGQPAAEGAPGAWKVYFTSKMQDLHRLEPPQEFDDGNRLAPEFALECEDTLDLPYAYIYSMNSEFADEYVGGRRARQMGFVPENSDGYEELQQSLMPDRENRSHLLGWSHPQVIGDDPADEGFRNLLTVASERKCGWCWADGHQLYYNIAEDDLSQGIFSRTKILDG